MGYFKNQLIAQQVEVGDRYPARSARDHIGYPTRRMNRQISKIVQPVTTHRRTFRLIVVGTALCGILTGFLMGVAI